MDASKRETGSAELPGGIDSWPIPRPGYLREALDPRLEVLDDLAGEDPPMNLP